MRAPLLPKAPPVSVSTPLHVLYSSAAAECCGMLRSTSGMCYSCHCHSRIPLPYPTLVSSLRIQLGDGPSPSHHACSLRQSSTKRIERGACRQLAACSLQACGVYTSSLHAAAGSSQPASIQLASGDSRSRAQLMPHPSFEPGGATASKSTGIPLSRRPLGEVWWPGRH